MSDKLSICNYKIIRGNLEQRVRTLWYFLLCSVQGVLRLSVLCKRLRTSRMHSWWWDTADGGGCKQSHSRTSHTGKKNHSQSLKVSKQSVGPVIYCRWPKAISELAIPDKLPSRHLQMQKRVRKFLFNYCIGELRGASRGSESFHNCSMIDTWSVGSLHHGPARHWSLWADFIPSPSTDNTMIIRMGFMTVSGSGSVMH